MPSAVKAYNEAIPGLDRFIVAKSRKLKQLGSAKGRGQEHTIEQLEGYITGKYPG